MNQVVEAQAEAHIRPVCPAVGSFAARNVEISMATWMKINGPQVHFDTRELQKKLKNKTKPNTVGGYFKKAVKRQTGLSKSEVAVNLIIG